MRKIPDWVKLAHEAFYARTGVLLESKSHELRTRVLVAALDAEPGGDDAVIAAVGEMIGVLRTERMVRKARNP